MADQQHPFTPPQGKDLLVFGGVVYRWWEEACKRPPSSFYEKLNYLAAKATEWGWQERDASVPGELQQARDQELDACCEWIEREFGHGMEWGAELRAARRSEPKSRKQRALDALTQIEDQCLSADLAAEIRNALEELPDD